LGEFFRCRYDYPNGTQGFYIAEQVSHHPPISAFYYVSPVNKVAIVGELRPKSKFLGNSVSTTMEGESRITLMDRPEDAEYVLTMPNMYARGILFGKMVIELGDTCTVRNGAQDLHADIEFKTKGFFSGTYNALAGRVKHGSNELGEVMGKWSALMEFKTAKTGEKRTLFDAQKDGSDVAPKWVTPEDEQEPYESRRLWRDLTRAILAKDMDAATESKTAVENAQRELRATGIKHATRFFELQDGRWVPRIQLPQDPQEATSAVKAWIWSRPSESSAGDH